MSMRMYYVATKAQKYNKKYYENNKEKIIDHLLQPVCCEYCDKTITLGALSKHNKSKKHLRNIEIKNIHNDMKELEDKLKTLQKKKF